MTPYTYYPSTVEASGPLGRRFKKLANKAFNPIEHAKMLAKASDPRTHLRIARKVASGQPMDVGGPLGRRFKKLANKAFNPIEHAKMLAKASDPRRHLKLARKLVSGEDVEPGETPWDVHVGIRDGHAFAVHPATGTIDSVSLRTCGEWLESQGVIVGSEELYDTLDTLDERPEVSGKIAKKIKKGLKKGVQAVATAAKKIAKSKVVQALASAVKAAVPQPFKMGITALETGVKFAKTMLKAPKGSPHAKAKPLVVALAAGKISREDAEEQAADLGLDPDEVSETAAALKIRAQAHAGNPQAKGMVAAAETLDRAENGTPDDARAAIQLAAEAKLRGSLPGARVVQVHMPGGRIFLTAVAPVA